jgi:hypothetical protein
MSLSKSMNTNSSGKGIGTFTVLSSVVWLNNTRTFRPARRIKRERTSLSILSALAESAPVHASILARTFIKLRKNICCVNLRESGLGLDGKETFNIDIHHGKLSVGQSLNVTTSSCKTFAVTVRLDTAAEL